MAPKVKLSASDIQNLIETLEKRFSKNMHRHKGIKWTDVEKKLEAGKAKLRPLFEMENTGGEPDVIGYDKKTGNYLFCDCSPESPKGRRSLCYDSEALASRKEHKPKNSAMNMAYEMGIQVLSEEDYRNLQKLENFDTKTSSWLKTPDSIRELGGSIFGDYRFGQVFVYHNGAESYYSSRGFRGLFSI
jgi:hypothetical protein